MKATTVNRIAATFAIGIATQTAALWAQETAVDPYKNQPASEPLVTAPTLEQVSIREEVFSVDSKDAFDIVHQNSTDEQKFKRLVELMAQGKAAVEKLTLLRTKSGQRAVVESIREFRYPTEFDLSGATNRRDNEPPRPQNQNEASQPAKAPEPATPLPAGQFGLGPTAFETRNVGDTLEVEPVIGPDGKTIDLNLVPQRVRYLGETEMSGSYAIRQPVFATQKTTTSITVAAGKPLLLSAWDTPPNTTSIGAQEPPTHRTWFTFMTAEIVASTGTLVENPTLTGWGLALAEVIPVVNFTETNFRDALSWIHQQSVELDPNKAGVDIVLSPETKAANGVITLKLKNTTVANAITYVARLANLDVEGTGNSVRIVPARQKR